MDMLTKLPIIGGLLDELMKLSFAEFLIRKSAHMFLYFVLSAMYACSDEIHQLFIIGRSGEIRDVLVDSTGALIGLLLIFICKKSS